MSETDKDDSQPDAMFAEDTADEKAVEKTNAKTNAKTDEKSDEKPGKTAKLRGKGGAATSIAWLALFLSLLAVAGVGHLLLQKQRADNATAGNSLALAALQGELRDSTQSVDAIRGDVSALASEDSRSNAAVDALRRDLDQRGELFDSLPPRMSSLERSVAALQGVSIEARNTYLIAEAEYYLQIGNAQLQLAGNAYLASLALSQADDRLLQLADPALTGVRGAIADEIAALEVMEKPDIAGVTLILASLARVIDSLPMRGAGAADVTEEAVIGSEQSGASRAWEAVKNAASGLVKVTPPDAGQAALLTPDSADLARSNLALQLQAARLALLRGEQQIFEQSLDDADEWLQLYFDTSSEPVRSARQTIGEIRTGYSAVAAPDISQSLRLLRQYRTLAEPLQ